MQTQPKGIECYLRSTSASRNSPASDYYNLSSPPQIPTAYKFDFCKDHLGSQTKVRIWFQSTTLRQAQIELVLCSSVYGSQKRCVDINVLKLSQCATWLYQASLQQKIIASDSSAFKSQVFWSSVSNSATRCATLCTASSKHCRFPNEFVKVLSSKVLSVWPFLHHSCKAKQSVKKSRERNKSGTQLQAMEFFGPVIIFQVNI